MILMKHGPAVASVIPRFDARAMTEIRFSRTEDFECPTEEFEAGWDRVRGHELAPTSEGDVQDAAERELLSRLQALLDDIEEGLGEGEVALVENQKGTDYPKTRDRKKPVIVEGENRFRSEWRVEPALRIGIYRRRA